MSILRDDVRRRLRKVVMPYNGHILRGGDGSFIPTIGQCTSRVRFQKWLYFVEFVIIQSCSHDVIIGWDSLSSLDAIIDCARGELVFFEFPVSEPERSSGVRLYSHDNYTVPAVTAVVITVEARQPYDKTVLFEPEHGTLLEKGIAISRSLITLCEGKAEVWAVSLMQNSQLLPKKDVCSFG